MDRAHVAGDIAMLEPEVNPVISALRKHHLEVVALHNHMLGEEPADGLPPLLGDRTRRRSSPQGFRAALDELGRHGKTLRMQKMRRVGHA